MGEAAVTIRVLLADDQPLIRAGIAMLLAAETDIEIAGEADDGVEAIEQARKLQPDVVVMDIRMPRADGVEATRRVTGDSFSANPDKPVKVLVLTTYNVDETVYAALRAGASGYLLKHAAPAELVRAVRAVAAGDGWLDPGITRQLIEEFAARPEPHVPTPAELDRLTARECEVLVLVAHGLSNSEIAEWLVIGEGTVKTHFGRILMKLAIRDRAQAVAAAYQTGLVRPGDSPPPGPGRP
jgi:DNA-binding NarL/FixJ family response regulator